MTLLLFETYASTFLVSWCALQNCTIPLPFEMFAGSYASTKWLCQLFLKQGRLLTVSCMMSEVFGLGICSLLNLNSSTTSFICSTLSNRYSKLVSEDI